MPAGNDVYAKVSGLWGAIDSLKEKVKYELNNLKEYISEHKADTYKELRKLSSRIETLEADKRKGYK